LKKGCFVKAVIIVTVLLAVVLFLLQNYFDELILKPGEKIIKGLVFKGVIKEMEHVKESPEKDSLRVLLDNFIQRKFKKKENININGEEINQLADSVKKAFADSMLSADELEKIKKLLESK
jgi:hypothetical protein